MREWTVAGGLLETPDGVLLVRNLRRGGIEDWSTPGGVIDADDADLLAGLTREVEEETGLRVQRVERPAVRGAGARARHGLADALRGAPRGRVRGRRVVDDPDGIVVEAAFVPPTECAALLASCAPWVGEPLAAWLRDRWEPGQRRRLPLRRVRHDARRHACRARRP